MCGRFSLITPPARVARYFEAVLDDRADPDRPPSYNVAPTDPVLGVRDRRNDEDGSISRILTGYRWGLIPSWSKDPSAGSRLFNARAETVVTRPSFRDAFRQRRIIVPADGFYEWRKTNKGGKEPHYFARVDGTPLAFAGLAEWWRDRSSPDAPPIYSCTIITTTASQDMDGIHDRMPVILNPDVFDVWLSPDNEDTNELAALLRNRAGILTHYAVGPRVGSVKNNDATLIDRV
ncbi:MAG TPA: SOS response-associated peptidase [Acidimicrobiales bacterium]|nr:SOS response-associated peptidase [Acidimicrobiales bacterium]